MKETVKLLRNLMENEYNGTYENFHFHIHLCITKKDQKRNKKITKKKEVGIAMTLIKFLNFRIKMQWYKIRQITL